MTALSVARSCGPCNICCTLPSISELSKPAHTPCDRLAPAGGCGSYSERPQTCQKYACLWLRGLFLDSDRPDLIGAIFEYWEDAEAEQVLRARLAKRVTDRALILIAAFSMRLPVAILEETV